jgi:transposase
MNPAQLPGRAAELMPTAADQSSEITRLERELDRRRMERDVLKEAIGIFAEVPR